MHGPLQHMACKPFHWWKAKFVKYKILLSIKKILAIAAIREI